MSGPAMHICEEKASLEPTEFCQSCWHQCVHAVRGFCAVPSVSSPPQCYGPCICRSPAGPLLSYIEIVAVLKMK